MAKLFVGGLSSRTTEESMKLAFSRFGDVKEVIVMKERGFGFVTFEDQEAADKALEETRQELDGSKVDVKPAVSKGSGGDRGGGGGGGNERNVKTDKVFVGGLPQDCADDKIKEYFSRYGAIVDAIVMKDRETNRSRGFGFVQFESPEAVEKVILDYSSHKIEGKWVEVKKSIPRDKMSSAPPSNSKGSGRGSSCVGGGCCGGGSNCCGGGGGGPGGCYGGCSGGCGGGGCGGYPAGYGYGAYPGYGYPGYGYPGYGYPGYGMPGYGGYGMEAYGFGAYTAPPTSSSGGGGGGGGRDRGSGSSRHSRSAPY